MLRPAMLVAALLLAPLGCAAVDAQKQVQTDAHDQDKSPNVIERSCSDDKGNDRCSDESQRKMRERYGIADVETLSAQGVILRRAMLVNGYGLDIAAITFSRVPGRPPMVEVAMPRQDAEPERQPLRAIVDQDTWNRVLEASADFDQQLVRELPANSKSLLKLCLHSWFAVVESVDPARLSQRVVGQHELPAVIRRDVEDACDDGLAMRYAFEMARVAREQLPECSSLQLDDFRNDADLLALCHRLGGDRHAGADAYRFLRKLSRSPVPDPRELDWLELEAFGFRYFARSSEHLAKPFLQALGGANLHFEAPHGTDLDHASVEGRAYFPGEESSQTADLKLKLVRQNRDFVILSYEVSNKRQYD